jgi:exopolysaccharide biosynthesis protein
MLRYTAKGQVGAGSRCSLSRTILSKSYENQILVENYSTTVSCTTWSSGETYTQLTDQLQAAGFSDAVFCDGSDSAMMWYQGRIIVTPGTRKADSMTVAIGFAATVSPLQHKK